MSDIELGTHFGINGIIGAGLYLLVQLLQSGGVKYKNRYQDARLN
jgi:hypothetical protein